MDKGAARSRKRVVKVTQNPVPEPGSGSGPSRPLPSIGAPPLTSRERERLPKPRPPPKRIQQPGPPDDPNQYKPKAIRTSAALIWKDSQFPIPPPRDMLSGVTRVDLAGSQVQDVSWLQGAGVTWLSLNGCKIEDWTVVGQLSELSVLNINDCGLKTMPKSLKSLGKLKAVVAMNNEWTELDDEVILGWKELNSLIISHSPNLTKLPTSLRSLRHLSKLTFSHCPRLTSNSLPDLSNLPLLRDVRMNNLPLLTALPHHLVGWGTGRMSLVGKSEASELGDGLEGLDLGNCSLPFEAVSSLFLGSTKWPHLRSLSLHSNPLALSHTDYATLLQASENLPNLQIIDAKRVVERKGKGQIHAKSKGKGKILVKPTGANAGAEGKMRTWGDSGEKRKLESTGDDESATKRAKHDSGNSIDGPTRRKKGESFSEKSSIVKSSKHRKASTKTTIAGDEAKTSSRMNDVPIRKATAIPTITTTTTKADPTVLPAAPKRPTQSDTSVLKVIEVESGRPKTASKGLDLKELFSKKKTDGLDGDDDGLGVGGW